MAPEAHVPILRTNYTAQERFFGHSFGGAPSSRFFASDFRLKEKSEGFVPRHTSSGVTRILPCRVIHEAGARNLNKWLRLISTPELGNLGPVLIRQEKVTVDKQHNVHFIIRSHIANNELSRLRCAIAAQEIELECWRSLPKLKMDLQ